MKQAEYAYWAKQPTHVVMAAVSQMATEAYAMKGIHVSRLHRPHRAVAIDILPEIPGVTFDEAWKNRRTRIIDEDTGLRGHFISRSDLIAAKLAAGRPRDLADVDELRKAEAIESPTSAAQKRGRKLGKSDSQT